MARGTAVLRLDRTGVSLGAGCRGDSGAEEDQACRVAAAS